MQITLKDQMKLLISTERVKEVINNSSAERSNEVNDITVNESG